MRAEQYVDAMIKDTQENLALLKRIRAKHPDASTTMLGGKLVWTSGTIQPTGIGVLGSSVHVYELFEDKVPIYQWRGRDIEYLFMHSLREEAPDLHEALLQLLRK